MNERFTFFSGFREGPMTIRHLIRRASDALRILRTKGIVTFARRLVWAMSRSIGADVAAFPILVDDIADSAEISRVQLAPTKSVGPLTIGFIMTPPAGGSGGHTTTFRFIQALEAAGHTCVIYLYDRFGGSLPNQTQTIRAWWPHVHSEVRQVSGGLPPLDAYVATSWPTAHVLASRPTDSGQRFYLVQDFEPYFYARGPEYALAEDTYRFGFHCITVGQHLAEELRKRFDIIAEVAAFGCDIETYGLTNMELRDGVVFYSKPDTPRRGYGLGILALEEVHRRRPEVVIHTFGRRVSNLPFPAKVHPALSPVELSALYNQCIAGFAFSFTNLSLVATEMIASGTVPIANADPFIRSDLTNPFVEWSRATPSAMADAMCRVIDLGTDKDTLRQMSASVQTMSWEPAQASVVRAIERRCYATNSPDGSRASEPGSPF